MPNTLNEVAELSWKQLFPSGNDESKITKEEFIASARYEYANQLWLKLMAEKREDGYFDVPSYLLTEKELEVVDGVMDISGLKIMRTIPMEVWLQNIGGISCDCKYVKTTLNLAQTLCDDDSLSDSDKPYYVVGKKIKFTKGTHKSPLPIIYANNGESIDGDIEIDAQLGAIVRRVLVDIYGGKTGAEDKKNNSRSDA